MQTTNKAEELINILDPNKLQCTECNKWFTMKNNIILGSFSFYCRLCWDKKWNSNNDKQSRRIN